MIKFGYVSLVNHGSHSVGAKRSDNSKLGRKFGSQTRRLFVIVILSRYVFCFLPFHIFFMHVCTKN